MPEITQTDIININTAAIRAVAEHLNIDHEKFNSFEEVLNAINEQDQGYFILLNSFIEAYYNYQVFYEELERKEYNGIGKTEEENTQLQDLISERNRSRNLLIQSIQTN